MKILTGQDLLEVKESHSTLTLLAFVFKSVMSFCCEKERKALISDFS